MVRGAFQSWLVRSHDWTILVDTGVGNDKTRPGADMWDRLKLALRSASMRELAVISSMAARMPRASGQAR